MGTYNNSIEGGRPSAQALCVESTRPLKLEALQRGATGSFDKPIEAQHLPPEGSVACTQKGDT